MSHSPLMLPRKLYHCGMGLICFSLYAFVLTREQALWALFLIGLPGVILDGARLWIPSLNDVLFRFFRPIVRDKERHQLTGHSFFVLGLILIVWFCDKPIVLMSILFLALGDPIASYVGLRWGKTKLASGKTLEGAVANWLVSAAAVLVFLALYGNQTGLSLPLICLLGATISALSELMPLPVDDNFSIPVFSSSALMLARSVL